MTANTTTPRPTAHAACDHPNTKSARAKCRRDRAKAGDLVSIHTVVDQATKAYLAAPAPVASITAPNGTVIREGDIVTLTDSKIERRVVDVTDDRIRAVRTDGKIASQSVWTKQLNGVKIINA